MTQQEREKSYELQEPEIAGLKALLSEITPEANWEGLWNSGCLWVLLGLYKHLRGTPGREHGERHPFLADNTSCCVANLSDGRVCGCIQSQEVHQQEGVSPLPESVPARPKFGFLNGYGKQVYSPRETIWGELNTYMDALEALIAEKDAEIARLRGELDEAREAISWANNSLYGSLGYFLSLNGGAPDKYHLANGIEDRKRLASLAGQRAEAAESELQALRLAYGLSLELHGCGGENCTEALYVSDANKMINDLEALKASTAQAREEGKREGLREAVAAVKKVGSIIQYVPQRSRAGISQRKSNYVDCYEAILALLPTEPERTEI